MGLLNLLFGALFKPQKQSLGQTFDEEAYNKLNQAKINRIKAKYDMDTLEGISKIPVPIKKEPLENMPNITVKLEYILQRKATEHKKNNRFDLAIACLRKSNQLMPFSSVGYSRSDYERIVKYLAQNGQMREADKEQEYIDSVFGTIQIPQQNTFARFERPTNDSSFDFTDIKKVPFSTRDEYLLENKNREKAICDLLSLNGYLENRKITAKMLKFAPSSANQTDFVRLSFAPNTKSGKMSKFPYTIHFMTASSSAQIEMFHGEVHYLKDSTVGKFSIIHTEWIKAPIELGRSYRNNKKALISSYSYNFSTNTGERKRVN